jgi:hypothetical protein
VEYPDSPAWRERCERQLGFLERSYKGGNVLALYDALIMCEQAQCAIPPWLAEALKDFVHGALTGAKTGKRGRSNNPIKRHRENLKIFARKHAIQNIRDWQKDPKDWLGLPRRAVEAWFSGDLDAYAPTLENAFAIASIGLEGTFAEGSEETMRKAHFAVDPPFGLINQYETQVRFGLALRDDSGLPRPPEHIRRMLGWSEK